MHRTDEGLLLEGMFPASFQALDNFPEVGDLALLNEKNENYLRTCLISHDSIDVDEHDEISLELRRQDFKINLLLDMLGEFLVQQNKLPPSVKLNLTSMGLECSSSIAGYKVGEKVEIDLYINPSFPKALKLYGEVRAIDTEGRTAINFVGVNQSVQDWLEKFIFRHHRRTIAQSLMSK